ncbi:uncharacterized protein LOC110906291 [Helianthus annuus]|uniref:uncharacterized protein LOC110906291 n=1 Tax=Helianthus annuus TaxID=4232 RepID=UPI000B8F260B|nr:uncharacterized protein LOC110906291 [Helianthus annuus]
MASHVVSLTSFFLLIFCMHFSNARLLLQVSEKKSQVGSLVTPSPKGEYGKLNGQDIRKIDRDFKEGSEIVESSSSHHVALLKGKHFKDTKLSSLPQYFEKEEVVDPRNDDVVVMDYHLPQRKTPIHNK